MMNRRNMLGLVAATGVSTATAPSYSASTTGDPSEFDIVDSNISLFRWPFRRLPLDETQSLLRKLHALGISSAWAGSFECLLHRDISAVNDRLVAECDRYEALTPVGSVNPILPGWERDLTRCLDVHAMKIIRLHPGYHGYTLDDPRFDSLLRQTAAAGCAIQIAVAMEDTRTQHERFRVADVDLTPLPDTMSKVESARVQLLNYRPREPLFEKLTRTAGLYFDTARVDGTDGVPHLVRRVPHGRVLFGTHAPFLIPEAALIRIHESDQLDDEALQRIYSTNAGRFASRVGMNRSPRQLGLPAVDTLRGYRIWDSYFTQSHSHPGEDGSSRLLADIERSLPAIRKGQIEKLCYFPHVGAGTTADADFEGLVRSKPDTVLKPLQRWPQLLLGMIQLNANDLHASNDSINRWLRDGPMVGVYFPGGGPGACNCTHRNFDPLVERIAEFNGIIMQHTWFKTGGRTSAGESTPTDLARLAARHPQQKFVCAHAGGEWEQGIRAVQGSSNVLIETSGFDATAGFIEMAVRELGSNRIVFGTHLPSRSLGTELSKVIAANISEDDKHAILGANFRKLLGLTGSLELTSMAFSQHND